MVVDPAPRIRSARRGTPEASIGKSKPKILLILAVALIAISITIGLEASKHGFEWAKLRQVISGLQMPWMLLAISMAFLSYIGRAIRWRILILPIRPHPSLLGLTSATLIGYAAVAILGRPGEFVRPYLIAIKEKLPFSSQLAVWFVERLYDLLSAMLIFGFALSQVAAESSTMNPGPALSFVLRTGGWITFVLCTLCLGLLVGIRHFSDAAKKSVLKRLHFLSNHNLGRVERVISAFLEGAASTKSTSATLQIIFWSFFEWVLIAACYASVIRAFGPSLSFSLVDVLVFMGFVSFGSLVQLPGVGGGVQIAAVIVLTEIFDVPLETATGLAVLIWVLTFVMVVPFGVILALKEGITWATVRAAGREAVS